MRGARCRPRPRSRPRHAGARLPAALLAVVVAASLMAPARSALAEAPLTAGATRAPTSSFRSPEEEAAIIAEALFREAMTLMDAKKYADACPKLQESQRLAPGLGTRFHLGNCYEKLGRRATAWSTFIDLSEAARAAGNADGAKKARARADALLPLPKLTIVVPDAVAATPDIEIKRDGVALGRAAWGTAIPVDPGDHTVSAAAPDKVAWTSTISVDAPSGSAQVNVPTLMDASGSGIGRRGAGLLVGAVGAAGLIAGGIFGAVALSRAGDARAECAGSASNAGNAGDGIACKPTTVAANNGAYTFADLSTGFFIAGGAAIAAGAVLWITAPAREKSSSARLVLIPIAGAGAAGGLLEGTF